jgi:Uma2 family endonuclease
MVAAPPRPSATARYTTADLDSFPDDGKLRELVDGHLVAWDAPNRLHGYFMGALSRLIGNRVAEANLGLILTGDPLIRIQNSEHDARGPDLCFYARGRIPHDLTVAVGEEPPDFVVEILSPTDRAGEVQRKVVDWLRAGVKLLLLWYIDPDTGTTIVYHAGWITTVGAVQVVVGADVLPGLRLRLHTVFIQLAALQAEPE